MSRLGASRFTALLAAVAISGMAGTFWWALETRSDMKAAASRHEASRSLPPKFTGRVSRSKDERPGKFETNKFELMGKSVQPGSPARGGDDQPDRQTSPPLLANYPSPGQGPGLQSRSLPTPVSPSPVLSSPVLPSPVSQAAISQNQTSQGPPSSQGDMPLPALPAMAPLVPDQPESASWQASAAATPFFLPQLPATPPVENQKRQTRPGPPAAARAPKPAAQSYYTEKFVEQGEYHYRRRLCEPPNMPDVCFMPQADRQPIVVAKP
jgi:hypothetical protein